MKKLLFILIPLFIFFAGVYAQVVAVNHKAKSYLHDGKVTSGGYTIEELAPLLAQPLITIDEEGKKRQAVSFYFTYKERNVYYDENGKPFIDADSYTSDSENGRISDIWLQMLPEKMKTGDTLKFESIKCLYDMKKSDSAFYAEPITIYIK